MPRELRAELVAARLADLRARTAQDASFARRATRALAELRALCDLARHLHAPR